MLLQKKPKFRFFYNNITWQFLYYVLMFYLSSSINIKAIFLYMHFIPCLFILKGVLAANDPVAVYPLKGTVATRDASKCNNEEAEMLDKSGSKISNGNGDQATFKPDELCTIRITNNNGNLKVKSLTILLRIKFRVTGNRTIVAFSAQGKSVLLLSLQQNEIRFSMNASDGEYVSAKTMLDSKGKVQEREWYSLAVSYSHITGFVTLRSSEGKSAYRGFLGILDVEETEYVYLGNNMQSAAGSREHHYLNPFLGRMECFMLYRRSLNFSEILQAMDLCQKLPNDKGNDDYDYDNDNDNDDERGGKLSYNPSNLFARVRLV